MDDKTKIIVLSVILVLILAAAVVYFVFYDKKDCPILPKKYFPTQQNLFYFLLVFVRIYL
jgi:flagellar basal body-associated protein FliL